MDLPYQRFQTFHNAVSANMKDANAVSANMKVANMKVVTTTKTSQSLLQNYSLQARSEILVRAAMQFSPVFDQPSL